MRQDPITKTTYFKAYVALLALLALTVGAVYVNLGSANMLITMAIAVTKALVVVFFFMHVRYSARLIWIYAVLGVIWIATLIGGTLADVVTRR